MAGQKMKQRNFIKWLVSRKRNQRGWTQDEFANKLQLVGWYDGSRSTVSKIEDGSLRIDLLQLYFIAVALGVSPKDFLAEIDWHKQAEKMISFSMKHSQPMETYGNHPEN